jgi:hypothetical protein
MTDVEFDQLMNAVAREWDLPHLNETAGISPQWLQSFLALRIADLVAQIAVGDRLKNLNKHDRDWFKAQAEALIRHPRIDIMLLRAKVPIRNELLPTCRWCGDRHAVEQLCARAQLDNATVVLFLSTTAVIGAALTPQWPGKTAGTRGGGSGDGVSPSQHRPNRRGGMEPDRQPAHGRQHLRHADSGRDATGAQEATDECPFVISILITITPTTRPISRRPSRTGSDERESVGAFGPTRV